MALGIEEKRLNWNLTEHTSILSNILVNIPNEI